MKKIFRHWKVIYAICCLVYMGWVINVGTNEFDRINTQYQRLNDLLEEGSIRNGALEELVIECRREARKALNIQEDACSFWSPTEIEAREKIIEQRRMKAREKGFIKVIMFYSGFVLIFLLTPPLFIYILLAGAIKLFKTVKFVR